MKKFFKWLAIILGIVIVIFVIAVYLMIRSTDRRMSEVYSVNASLITIPSDTASIEIGKRWASALCMHCHGDNLGGTEFFNDPSLGKIYAPNITSGKGGVAGTFTDVDWIRALRHGIKPDGTPIFAMPTGDFNNLDDHDLGDIIAYLKTVPPVDKEWDKTQLTSMCKVLIAMGAFGDIIGAENIQHDVPVPPAPEEAMTVNYGGYMTKVFGCTSCHGKMLNGGKSPDPNAPFAPNLTPGGDLAGWDSPEFVRVLRTGRTPDGRQLSEFMPWRSTAYLSDTALTAIYTYLRSLPKLETTKH